MYASNAITTTYFVEPDSLVVHEDAIKARLTLFHHEYFANNEADYRAAHLDLHIALFQEGIMQVKIKAADEAERFAISNTGIGIDWDQIKVQQHLRDFVKILDDGILVSGQDKVSYKIQFDPFRIIQYVNGRETIIVNDNDNLYYDAKDLSTHNVYHHEVTVPVVEGTKKDDKKANGAKPAADVHGYSVGLDFTVNAAHVYGLPERNEGFLLEMTGFDHPYRLFNQDRQLREELGKNSEPLYGSVPYIAGHSRHIDASIAWMNSAETFVFLNHANQGTKTNSAFVSEGNALEFYLLGAEASPKKLSHKLSELTGYTPLPPIHTLGYHFSKWEDNSADQIVERNADFTKFGFPVDVFWFDSEYAQDYQYGEFDHKRFSQNDVMVMNEAVHNSGRRFVIAADPHIRASQDFFMYKEGLEKQGKLLEDHHIANLFVRDPSGQKPFVGVARPGKSVWIDFLNDSACDYWKDLFHPSVFRGTNYMYGVWNDMNEPSVYKSASDSHQVGMPLDNTHMTIDGDILQHRWIHNAYGALQQRATYQGLLKRDRGQQRPFLLSRSFFLGSQRYGTLAGGSNHANFEDVAMSINMLLSLGVSGIVNAGYDVPGYAGVPEDDLYVQFYQLGVYYPFFRANARKGNEMREPWLQSPRIQRMILAAIEQRYAQTHYLYTAFFEASVKGTPIVRPMWYEFPHDEVTFELQNQFMFGPHVLVAPKIGIPSVQNAILGGSTEVEIYLPPTVQWYDMYTKLEVTANENLHMWLVADAEQGTFVRGGAILPVLNFKDGPESLLQAIDEPIRLEIYSDNLGDRPHARGSLYLDDGESHNNRHHERTEVDYTYDGSHISVTKIIGDENLYVPAQTKIVDEVLIFGVEHKPKRVLNRFAMHADGQGEVDADWVWVESTKMVHIYKLRIPVDEGLFYGHTIDILELVY